MAAFAAAMTGPGAGAIATVLLLGESAEAVVSEVFRSSVAKPTGFATGCILLGHIVDGADTVDEVTIGCEGPDAFAIHCHGNPLIVERIMKLLQSRGAELLDAQSLLAKMLSAERAGDSIAVEAKLTLTKVKTVEGARIITRQMEGGLSEQVRHWSAELDSMSLEEIGNEARQILRDSETARLITFGCTIALVGPPNSGKSTLLNALAGCEKAIVTDVKGTTRDWVSTEILIPPLAATVIDTAGQDAELAATSGEIDEAAQARSIEIVHRADLVLLVLDLSVPALTVSEKLLGVLADKRILTVLNKSDLPPHLDLAALPAGPGESIRISAKQSTGLDNLIRAIGRSLGVADFAPRTPIAFTARQRTLLERLSSADSPAVAATILTNLLHGPIQD